MARAISPKVGTCPAVRTSHPPIGRLLEFLPLLLIQINELGPPKGYVFVCFMCKISQVACNVRVVDERRFGASECMLYVAGNPSA